MSRTFGIYFRAGHPIVVQITVLRSDILLQTFFQSEHVGRVRRSSIHTLFESPRHAVLNDILWPGEGMGKKENEFVARFRTRSSYVITHVKLMTFILMSATFSVEWSKRAFFN